MDKKLKTGIAWMAVAIVGLITFSTIVSAELGGSTPLHIQDIGLNSVDYGGVDYPNWTDGNLCMGVTYDRGIEVTANVNVGDFFLVVQFERPNITAESALIQFWNGTAWNDASSNLTDSALRYTFPDAHWSLSGGESMLIPILVTYTEMGDYRVFVWCEGAE
jgi:hypothetical protein